MKEIMKVEMYGKTIIIRRYLGGAEFRVYRLEGLKNPYHLDSFDTFQEAWEYAAKELWG